MDVHYQPPNLYSRTILYGRVKSPKLLTFVDYVGSKALDIVITEMLADHYRLSEIPFEPGDNVLDVGAHIGFFSICLATERPDLAIYAFEPFPENLHCLRENIRLNAVTNVTVIGKAVTGDARKLKMIGNPHDNSAGATAHLSDMNLPGHVIRDELPSTSLSEIFKEFELKRVKLLKIDCEGSEYEILLNTPQDLLRRIEYLRAEFHVNQKLLRDGYTPRSLLNYVASVIPTARMRITECKMAE